MDNKTKELATKISSDIQNGKKPTIINKFMKNFFFGALRSKQEIKDVEKVIGKLDAVTLIIVKGKNILRAQSLSGKKEDVPMTEEEIQNILKNFNVKKESVNACKSIFVQLNFTTKIISIQQNKIDGTVSNLYL